MPADEAVIFREIVAALPAGWINAASLPILRCLVSHSITANALAARVAQAREAEHWARVDALSRKQEASSKLIADLSTRLRFLPRSRLSEERADTMKAQAAERPWEVKS
jgi:hypothetical protein